MSGSRPTEAQYLPANPVALRAATGIVAILLGLAGPVPSLTGQTVSDVTLPGGLPAVFEGPSFTSPTSFAVCGGASIHVFAGLPHAAVHSAVVPSGALAMGGPWSRLSANVAVYRGVGANMVPGDGDDPLVLVTGLPDAPILVDSGVTGIDAEFDAVNDTTAVQARSTGFVILRHGVFPAVLVGITVPMVLATAPGFRTGRVGDDVFVALACGNDHLPGTGDDVLAVVRGLKSPPASFTVDYHALPPGTVPRGFTVSPSGVPIVYEGDLAPSVRLTIARGLPYAPSWSVELVTPPSTPSPTFAPVIDVAPGVGDTVIVSSSDDAGPGFGRVLLGSLREPTPVLLATWYDNDNCGCASTHVDEHELALYAATGALSFSYHIVGTAQPLTFTQPQPWSAAPLFLKPNPTVVAVFSDDWTTAPGSALATIIMDLGPGRASAQFAVPGSWAGGGTGTFGTRSPPRLVTLGAGRVAGFVAFPSAPSTLALLRVFSTPTARTIADGTSAGPSPLPLSVLRPDLPLGLPLRVSLTVPPVFTTPTVVVLFATRLTSPQQFPGYLAPQASVILDLATTLAMLPMTVSGSQAALALDVAALAPALSGVELYLQVVVQGGMSLPVVTDAWQLVLF